METIGPAGFPEALAAWALHEWRGRHGQPVEGVPELELRFHAVANLLHVRRNVIAAMMAGGIVECLGVRVTPDDLPLIFVMGAQPVEVWSKNKLQELDTDGSADHCRRLAAGAAPVEGPFLAVARSADGPITIFDGTHRMAAWVAHVKEGRGYPLEVNVVVTGGPSPVFELPP